jgi:DNA polymerase IV (DinB-like DNA polymerase)
VLSILSGPRQENNPDQNDWNGSRVVMCIDLDAFYPSCEEIRDPSLIGKPHAVIMTDEEEKNITKGVVASCSYEARRFGVKSAMPLVKATEICPTLLLKPVDIPYYRQVSDQVMAILGTYADTLEQTSIDEAYLDCTKKLLSSSRANSNVKQYSTAIKIKIKQQCNLMTSIGVAPTKSAAKIASDLRKPDGLTIVYPDQLQGFLENLEVERISGIGTKTQQVLKKEMGIHTIGILAKYDVQTLMERFGKKHGLWMWRVANGQDETPVVNREDHVSLSTEHTLDSFTHDKAVLLKYFYELVDSLYERVKSQDYQFKTVGIKIVRSNFAVETREKTYLSYQTSRGSISSVIEELLYRFSIDDNLPITLGVRKVGLKVSNLMNRRKKESASVQKTLPDYI